MLRLLFRADQHTTPSKGGAVEAWVRDEMDKLESRRERPDETAWEVETRGSKARREADAAGLASLPPELLQLVWEHSTAHDLARLALTNAYWALAVAPARRASAMSRPDRPCCRSARL